MGSFNVFEFMWRWMSSLPSPVLVVTSNLEVRQICKFPRLIKLAGRCDIENVGTSTVACGKEATPDCWRALRESNYGEVNDHL